MWVETISRHGDKYLFNLVCCTFIGTTDYNRIDFYRDPHDSRLSTTVEYPDGPTRDAEYKRISRLILRINCSNVSEEGTLPK